MIALSMIFKGTEKPQEIVRCLSSIAPYVDAIYMTVTRDFKGKAVDIAKTFGAVVSEFTWTEDFSEARNFNLKQIPDTYEHIMWLDTDDVVIGGESIKPYLAMNMDRYFMKYWYAIDESTGKVLQSHPRERIVRKRMFIWGAKGLPVGALHENLTPLVEPIKDQFIDKVVIKHLPDNQEAQGKGKRNLTILESVYKKEGKQHDPRTEFYLSRCLIDDKQDARAEKLLWDYLEHSGWDEERAMAYQYLGDIYKRNAKPEEAIACYMSATKERHDFPWLYIRLASVYADLEDWDRVIFYQNIAMKMPVPKTGMVLTPQDDQILSLVNLFEALFGKRKLKECLAVTKQIREILPKDEFWKEKQLQLLEVIKAGELSRHVLDLVQEAKDLKEPQIAQGLLLNVPSSIADNALIVSLRNEYIPPKTWGEDTICYLTGQGAEEWDDTSLKTGVGGSETAVIYLSKYWSKMGYKVTVFGNPHKEHTDSDGVVWKNWYGFNYKDNYNYIIAWRNPYVFDEKVNAKVKALDLHDLPYTLDVNDERLKEITHVMCKSKFQTDALMNRNAMDKVVIIPNGYEPCTTKAKREPKRLIYTSSYDRGLYEALKYGWPIIRKEHPDAELHIYYGWNIFDIFTRGNAERQLFKKKMIELMKQDGVFEHGRISQQELMNERARSSIHYYPTTFTEIDCISIRESAAVGCIPVVGSHSVFPERAYCDHSVQGNPYDKRVQEKIAKRVVELLNSDLTAMRDEYSKLAQKESWEEIAKRWKDEVFT